MTQQLHIGRHQSRLRLLQHHFFRTHLRLWLGSMLHYLPPWLPGFVELMGANGGAATRTILPAPFLASTSNKHSGQRRHPHGKKTTWSDVGLIGDEHHWHLRLSVSTFRVIGRLPCCWPDSAPTALFDIWTRTRLSALFGEANIYS
jgi:hypothetical protein